MAKKIDKKPERRKAPQRTTPLQKRASNATAPNVTRKPKKERDDSTIYLVSFGILAFSIISFLSVISYFVYWKEDQSISQWSTLFVRNPEEANNFMGRFGAIIGELFVGEWFGVFGILIPALLFILSFILTNIKINLLKKVFISISLLTILGSTSAAYFSSSLPGIYGSSLGGGFGTFTLEWMSSIFGNEGCGVVLVLLLTAWVLYTYKNSAKYINMALLIIKNIFLMLISPILTWQPNKRPSAPIKQTNIPNQSQLNPVIPPPATTNYNNDTIEGFEGERFTEIGNDIYDQQTGELISSHQDALIPACDSPEEDADIIDPIRGTGNSLRGVTTEDQSDDPIDHYDYSNMIDLDNAVVFNVPIYDTTKPGTIFSDDDPEMELHEVATDKPVVDDSVIPLQLSQEVSKETYPTVKPTTAEPDFEITLPSDHDTPTDKPSISEKKPFEISVTDNADLVLDTLPDDENIVVTTNESSEMDQIDNSVFDPTLELSRYKLPSIDLLENHTRKVMVTEEELYENKNKILETLNNFNIQIDKIKATIGPTVTLYEIVPAPGVRISKIKNLEDDIALSLSALGIRIIAPIPGKGTIGIEVPNKNKEVVSMYSVIKSVRFQESDYDLPVVLGRTIQNEDYVIDLAKMPHLLVAGATGQGKSVGLNAIITSLLYKKHPAELKFVLVDPKKVELTLYSHLEKHFLAKLPSEDEAIITDTQKVVYTLNSLCIEMDTRYDLLKRAKVRNIKEYNQKFTIRHLNPNKGHRFLPYFVVIIDEFADLIMTAGREIETPIARIAQLARAVGIHLVIATQRPTTNIITGLIKANFPARIAFRVTSMIDSRTILDQPGANQLIGRGDMLVSTGNDTTRVQCAFIDTPEVERITEFIGKQTGYGSAYDLPDYTPENGDMEIEGGGREVKRDGLFDEVARYVVTNQQGSASTIQRNFNIGFNRAGRIMDQLERVGIVGKQEGSKPRKVMIGDISSLEMLLVEMDLKQ